VTARRAIVTLVCLAAAPTAAAGQDFEAPCAGRAADGALRFLEAGVPTASATPSMAGLTIARFGVADLATRAVGAAGGLRAFRIAAGLSQTGDPELGWTALGVAVGAGGKDGGLGLRGVLRRDRHPRPEGTAIAPGIGAEAGAGVWVRAARGLDLWAEAPQLWERGGAAPLARALRIGAAFRIDEIRVWGEYDAPASRVASAAGHHLGLAVGGGPLVVWLGARDGPLRAALGVSAVAGVIDVRGEAESHPVLGEILRIALAVRAPRDGPP
jgi:hypothetical protein